MIVTLKILTDLQGKPDKDGKCKILKRNVQLLRQFETTNILAEQLINSKGQISKRWCFVKENDTYFKLNHSFQEIESMTGHKIIKGFKQ